MLENSSILIISEDNKIYRLETDIYVQKKINKKIEEKVKTYLSLEQIEFEGNNICEEDEILCIKNFDMSDEILETIKTQANVLKVQKNKFYISGFSMESDNKIKIKAIMIGVFDDKKNNYIIAFQNFNKGQYITPDKFNLFFDNNTFELEERRGITITDSVDCIYVNNNLLFRSLYQAKGVFDLSEYYKEATDDEVRTFISDKKLDFGDNDEKEKFLKNTNTTIRKLIASLNESKVLKKHDINDIEKRAKSFKINIEIKDKKIVMPKENAKIKEILRFLNDDIYLGVFSNEEYISNSKTKKNK